MAKCCAPNCFNNQRKDSAEFNFFDFPENPDLRARWISNIGRPNWMPGKRSMLCSAHFETSQLERVGQHICLCKHAIPTVFQLSGRRKGHVQPNTMSKRPEKYLSIELEVKDQSAKKSFSDQIAPKQQSEPTTTGYLSSEEGIKVELNNESVVFSNKSDTDFKTQIKSGKFMDEFVLIDGNYILEDGQLVEDTGVTQNSHETGQSLDVVEECRPLTDNIITIEKSSSSPSLENDQTCEEEPGSVIIMKSNAAGGMVLLQETFPLLSDNIMYIQQATEGLETIRSQSLNISEIATPCQGITASSSSAYSVSEMKSELVIQTECNLPDVPFKKQKLSDSGSIVSVAEESGECIVLSRETGLSQVSPQCPSLEKVVLDFPASLENHILGEKGNKQGYFSINWQKGTFMCRLCGVASNNTVNLFGDEANEMKLLERVSSVLPIKIVQCDELPQSVCSECLSKLNTCSELIVTSINTHRQLASVMGQDVKESFGIPVYFHGSKRNADINTKPKRHILLMEIFQEENKCVEECLGEAVKDLHSWLLPENADCVEPECSFMLIPLSDGHNVSHLEQVRTAAETLLTKGLIRTGRQKTDLPFRRSTALPKGFIEETTNQILQINNDDVFEDDLDETSSETTYVDERPTADSPSPFVELAEAFEIDLSEVHTMPITDDVSPYDFYSTEIKCPQMKGVWKGRGTIVNNMQKLFYWNESGGNVGITCRLCNEALDDQSSIHSHLKVHSDVSCEICQAVLPSQQDRNAHKCGPKSTPKLLRSQQSLGQKVWSSFSKRRFRPWYQCSFCSMHLKSKSMLEQHLQQVHAANAKCSACGFDSSDVCKAALHRRTCAEVRKQKEWQCRKCLELFSAQEEFLKHQASSGHDNKVTSWLCDVCGKKFTQAAKLSQHKKTHLPPEFKFIHQCPHCPKRYINASRLKEHMEKHEEKKYMCKVCGKLFGTKQILRQHEFTHGDPQFLCSICSRTFFRKSHLLKHMNVHSPGNTRANRSGPQPHRDGLNRCRECKHVFDQKNLLDHYKTSHPHVHLQNYICEICKEENTSYAELFQHQREAHKTGVKDCPFCQKTIDSSTQMKYHLMRHEGMFPYNCPLCSNGYTANSILQDHIRRKHTGEKPFECKQCFKRFPTSGALAQHNTVHSLPHQLLPCPFCNQGFKRKAHLDVHIRTHTGEKPYPCPICDRPFRQRPDCVKHVRVIHGEDPSKFDIRYHPNTCIEFPQVVSVADMELVLEGEDLMQASLEASQLLVSQ